jgi:DNA polymerase-3 subunit alpha
MASKFCVIYTETNGLHELNEDVSKKNLFAFARLVVLNYEIFTYKKNKTGDTVKSIKKVRHIIKPKCMYISDESFKVHGISNDIAKKTGIEIEKVLNEFKTDTKDIKVFVSHSTDFHIRTIIAEFTRYNMLISFNNSINIDIKSFSHDLKYPKLLDLYQHLFQDSKKNNQLDMISESFIKLYQTYKENN